MAYKDKKDQAKASNRYYYRNKSKVRAHNKNLLARNRAFRAALLEHSSCVDCGNSDVRVLEFDHVKGIKKGNISTMVSSCYSLKVIKEEIAKCEIRCKNCHAIITLQRLRGNSTVENKSHKLVVVGSTPTLAIDFAYLG